MLHKSNNLCQQVKHSLFDFWLKYEAFEQIILFIIFFNKTKH